MNVWLVDFDGKIENLALMRLAAYHKAQGDTVSLKLGRAEVDLFSAPPAKVYISCLFRWNRVQALAYFDRLPCDKEIGGTGVDLERSLGPDVAACEPDYTLYGRDRAIGFLSRGCPRRCPWCVVPRKEGRLKRVATAAQVVGERQEAIFLDNNFLGLADCVDDLFWLARGQVAIDFNQGLDARLVTPEIAYHLAACNWSIGPRFSLDSLQTEKAAGAAVEMLVGAGLPASQLFFYCLIGFDGFESDYERLTFLYRLGVRVFPMGYRDPDTGEEPARGWKRPLYDKYRRLIIRIPQAKSVWEDFAYEVRNGHSKPPHSEAQLAFA